MVPHVAVFTSAPGTELTDQPSHLAGPHFSEVLKKHKLALSGAAVGHKKRDKQLAEGYRAMM